MHHYQTIRTIILIIITMSKVQQKTVCNSEKIPYYRVVVKILGDFIKSEERKLFKAYEAVHHRKSAEGEQILKLRVP